MLLIVLNELCLPLEAVFVNDGGDGAASVLFSATDDAADAADHDVMRRAENVGGHRDTEIDGAAHGHISVNLKEDSASGDVFGLSRCDR
jgi:hypothetical protein